MASTHILAIGKIEHGGEVDWDIAPLAVEEEVADGVLQDCIDYAAELQELEDGMLDREFWRSGGW